MVADNSPVARMLCSRALHHCSVHRCCRESRTLNQGAAATDLMLVGSVFSTLGALLGINLIVRGNSLANPGIGMLDVISVIKFVIGGGVSVFFYLFDSVQSYRRRGGSSSINKANEDWLQIARVTFKGDTCTLYESLTYTPSWPHRLIARDGILTQACHLNLWAATIGYVACASIAVNIVWRHSIRRSSKPKKADWLLDDRQLEA